MKITITVISVILIIVQIITNKIDWIVIALLTIGIIPWLSSLITSIELPGGVKIKYRDFEKIEERAEEGGLLEPSAEKQDVFEYSFQKVGLDEPNLALAGLRIEIETK